MRSPLYLSGERLADFSPAMPDSLAALIKRAVEALHIDDQADSHEIAARILALHTIGGRSPEEILELAIRLHREGFAPGGRRSDKSPPKRIRTERQRRKLKRP